MGAPFLPVRGILGSVYLDVNPDFKVVPDPFGGEEMVVVKALKPDVTLVHGSRADEFGNLLIPRLADWQLAIRASRLTVATVEERVKGPLEETAEWRLIPAMYVSALVHCPKGAAPGDFPPYYGLDEEHLALYLKSARDPAAWAEYLQKYVLEGKN